MKSRSARESKLVLMIVLVTGGCVNKGDDGGVLEISMDWFGFRNWSLVVVG
jgi:hypothetical protein